MTHATTDPWDDYPRPNEWTPSIPAWTRGKLTAMEMATLVSLLWFTDRHGHCWPSARQCMATVSMSRDAWFRNLRSLEEKGVVTRTGRTRPNGALRSNEYQVHLTTPVGQGDRPPMSE